MWQVCVSLCETVWSLGCGVRAGLEEFCVPGVSVLAVPVWLKSEAQYSNTHCCAVMCHEECLALMYWATFTMMCILWCVVKGVCVCVPCKLNSLLESWGVFVMWYFVVMWVVISELLLHWRSVTLNMGPTSRQQFTSGKGKQRGRKNKRNTKRIIRTR